MIKSLITVVSIADGLAVCFRVGNWGSGGC